jgi:uncharacterized protein
MIRAIFIFILLMVIYQAVKTVFRSAIAAYHDGEDRPPRIPGEEMVRDPQCRTYVVKGRAVSRSIGGQTTYFCSDACADDYVRDHRT